MDLFFSLATIGSSGRFPCFPNEPIFYIAYNNIKLVITTFALVGLGKHTDKRGHEKLFDLGYTLMLTIFLKTHFPEYI